jgi:two-component system, chemotaxis family, response regulator Rcp1
LDILIVENDPGTARLTKEALREAGLIENVKSLSDGDEALAYLRGGSHSSSQSLPDIIFLDLHLPKRSGLEVLEHIKADPKLSITPVVVISGSENPREIREAYRLHASCYVRKPDDLEHFLHFMNIAYQFWGEVVTLPPKAESSGL